MLSKNPSVHMAIGIGPGSITSQPALRDLLGDVGDELLH
jgi:hypothetical protein